MKKLLLSLITCTVLLTGCANKEGKGTNKEVKNETKQEQVTDLKNYIKNTEEIEEVETEPEVKETKEYICLGCQYVEKTTDDLTNFRCYTCEHVMIPKDLYDNEYCNKYAVYADGFYHVVVMNAYEYDNGLNLRCSLCDPNGPNEYERKTDYTDFNTALSNSEVGNCVICKCSELMINLNHIQGIGSVHSDCYENYPTCYNCGNKLLYFDEDGDSLCDSCDRVVYCPNCGNEGNIGNSNNYCDVCAFADAYTGMTECPSCGSLATLEYEGYSCFDCGEDVYVRINY